MKITNEDLREMKAMITADEADDPEEILNWFVENGPILIDEILAYRRNKKWDAYMFVNDTC